MDITCHFNLNSTSQLWKMVLSSSNSSIDECDVSGPDCEKNLINNDQLRGNCSTTRTFSNDPVPRYLVNFTCSLTELFAGTVCCFVRGDTRAIKDCNTFPLPTSKYATV